MDCFALNCFNYVSINNPKSRSFVNNFMEENNFVDLFRYEFLEKCCYQDIHLTIAPDLFLEALIVKDSRRID